MLPRTFADLLSVRFAGADHANRATLRGRMIAADIAGAALVVIVPGETLTGVTVLLDRIRGRFPNLSAEAMKRALVAAGAPDGPASAGAADPQGRRSRRHQGRALSGTTGLQDRGQEGSRSGGRDKEDTRKAA
ncbi:MAG TPA: hypothetical protein VMA37_09075 [Acetobacteraceae bacterium]|nr:hypothetical protein [Acetobacteraceae bacterium]